MSVELAASSGPAATAEGTLVRTAYLAGLGAALPERSVTSASIGEPLGISSEWIERRTGISERRLAKDTERVSDLAVRAGRAALADAGCAGCDVDMVLVATVAGDEITPPAAPLVAHELGAEGAAAIDVGAACTGALAGLSLASACIGSGQARNVLVIGAEILSRFLDFEDRRTAPLFGDGAGALLVRAEGDGALGPFLLSSDGSMAGAIKIGRERGVLEMEGHETFLNAARVLSVSTRELLERVRLSLSQVDLFVYHQANARVLRAVAERLGVPRERVYDCIGKTGNTSAASLPLALVAAREAGLLEPGMLIVLGAVGAGLSWGAGLLRWGGS